MVGRMKEENRCFDTDSYVRFIDCIDQLLRFIKILLKNAIRENKNMC